MDFVELTAHWEDVVDEACQWKIVANPESLNRGRPAELEAYSLHPMEDGRRGFVPGSVTVAFVLSFAVKAVSETAVGATACEWLRWAHTDWATESWALKYTCVAGTFKVYTVRILRGNVDVNNISSTVWEIVSIYYTLSTTDIFQLHFYIVCQTLQVHFHFNQCRHLH